MAAVAGSETRVKTMIVKDAIARPNRFKIYPLTDPAVKPLMM